MQGFFTSCAATFQFLNHWAFSHIFQPNLPSFFACSSIPVMTDWQAEEGKSKFTIRKEWDFFFNFRHIEINNDVMITSVPKKTEWSTIQGVIGRNFELDYR